MSQKHKTITDTHAYKIIGYFSKFTHRIRVKYLYHKQKADLLTSLISAVIGILYTAISTGHRCISQIRSEPAWKLLYIYIFRHQDSQPAKPADVSAANMKQKANAPSIQLLFGRMDCSVNVIIPRYTHAVFVTYAAIPATVALSHETSYCCLRVGYVYRN